MIDQDELEQERALTVQWHAPAEPFTERQLSLIKTTIAPGVDDDQLALFVEVAKRTGLDPFSRQIYAILRNARERDDKGNWHTVKRMTIQTGIDGYRAIAARTGRLAGIDDPTYDREYEENPGRATATVWRFVHGQRCAFTATARWSEYAVYKDEYEGEKKTGRKVLSDMWDRMPYLMLGKCAEALALRKAFPVEISGVYTEDEMAQASEPEHTVPAETEDERIKRRVAEAMQIRVPLAPAEQGTKSVDPWAEVRELAAQLGLNDDERADLFKRHKRNRDKILAELRERFYAETEGREPEPAEASA